MLTCSLTHRIADNIIINDIAFSLERGKHLLILGDSGAGKTTLLNLLAGIQAPSHGTVTYDGNDIRALKPAKRDRFRGENIGIIFQELHLIPIITIRENLQLIHSLTHDTPNDVYIDSLINSLDLQHRASQTVKDLSLGEQQRVAIARALVNQPAWIFADEPTSALDDKNTKATLQLLTSHAEDSGASLIIATHDKRVKDAFDNHTIIQLDK